MLKSAFPFEALLGSGIGQRIGNVIRRRRGNRGSDERSGPRIMLTGAKAQVHVCNICYGKIKEGTEYCWCRNGKVYHSVCFARSNGCPECRRTYAIKGRESSTSRVVSEQMVPIVEIEEVPPVVEESFSCPACGEEIAREADSCAACGAIFVAAGGTFACPDCGAEVSEDQGVCPSCGESFRPFTPCVCPNCGVQVGPKDEICECGAVLGERCPDCGAPLAEKDAVCSSCGATFDFA